MKLSGVLSLALGVIALAGQLQVERTEAVDEHAILDTPAPLAHHVAQAADLPNIVVIVSDDQGFADVSYQPHSEEVHTPRPPGSSGRAHDERLCQRLRLRA